MPKKEWTPEMRKAAGDRLKAAREAKKAATIEVEYNADNELHEVEQPTMPDTTPEQGVKVTVSQDELSQMLAYIKELEAKNWRQTQMQPQTTGATVGVNGLIGTVEKYTTDVDHYPSPVDRLFQEDRLRRFAFQDNFDLDYTIKTIGYQTLDGVRYKEPKFQLDLIRKIYDNETGELTNGRYVVCRLILHEDPDTALVIAQDAGIVIESTDEKTFLDEMRYLRFRDWVINCFYPAAVKRQENRKDMVIDGRQVEYFEVNAEETTASGSGIDWSKAPKISF